MQRYTVYFIWKLLWFECAMLCTAHSKQFQLFHDSGREQ